MSQHEIVEGPDYGKIDDEIRKLYEAGKEPKEIAEIIGLELQRVSRRIGILHRHHGLVYHKPVVKKSTISKLMAVPATNARMICLRCKERSKAIDCLITPKGAVKCPLCGHTHLNLLAERPRTDDVKTSSEEVSA